VSPNPRYQDYLFNICEFKIHRNALDPTGEFTVLPDPLADFHGAASQQGRGMEERGREGREREEEEGDGSVPPLLCLQFNQYLASSNLAFWPLNAPDYLGVANPLRSRLVYTFYFTTKDFNTLTKARVKAWVQHDFNGPRLTKVQKLSQKPCQHQDMIPYNYSTSLVTLGGDGLKYLSKTILSDTLKQNCLQARRPFGHAANSVRAPKEHQ